MAAGFVEAHRVIDLLTCKHLFSEVHGCLCNPCGRQLGFPVVLWEVVWALSGSFLAVSGPLDPKPAQSRARRGPNDLQKGTGNLKWQPRGVEPHPRTSEQLCAISSALSHAHCSRGSRSGFLAKWFWGSLGYHGQETTYFPETSGVHDTPHFSQMCAFWSFVPQTSQKTLGQQKHFGIPLIKCVFLLSIVASNRPPKVARTALPGRLVGSPALLLARRVPVGGCERPFSYEGFSC